LPAGTSPTTTPRHSSGGAASVGDTQSQPATCSSTAASQRAIALGSTRTLPARSEFERCRTHSSCRSGGLEPPQHSARRRAGAAWSALQSATASATAAESARAVRFAARGALFADVPASGASEVEQPVGRQAARAKVKTKNENERRRGDCTVRRTRRRGRSDFSPQTASPRATASIRCASVPSACRYAIPRRSSSVR
jgi:hypothetical protein